MKEIKRVSSTPIRLKEAMILRDKKQIDLVRETGINRSAISRYLSGEYEPKQTAIYKLAKALDVSEMWLWGYDCDMQRSIEQKNNEILADLIVRMRTDEIFLSVVKTLNEMDSTKLSSLLALLK